MMDCTDRHCRYFHRLLAPSALLYTEMVTAAALVHGDSDRLLEFDPSEHPVALQLGGSDPAAMAAAARLGAEAGYDEININVGCPSDRVQSGRFGACLMAEPEVVARCYAEMRAAVDVPVTVKTRIGIDERDDWAFFLEFVDTVAAAGCRVFAVHARKAYLSGLSPKENRTIPPLRYERVYRLKAERPELTVIVNGGIETPESAARHLERVDGVMIGRAAYRNPYALTDFEMRFGRGSVWSPPSRRAIAEQMAAYLEKEAGRGTPARRVTRHLLGLYAGQPGARGWRRCLAEEAGRSAGAEVIRRALDRLPSASPDTRRAAAG